MAQCPNCGAQVKVDAEECRNCTARFTSPDGWHPLPDGSTPVGEIRIPSQKGRDLDEERAKKRIPDETAFGLARTLTHLAIGLWIVSLFLPGFVVESRTEVWLGGPILLIGLLFGWLVSGWAVYANLFFPYVVIQLYRRKGAPLAVTTMVLLAATIVFFAGVIRDEGSGTVLPVVGWGIGAILWCVSLLVAAIASGIYLGMYRRKTALVLVYVISSCLLGLGILHFAQRFLANEQDRAIYLSKGMVFSTAKFCDAPFVWPDKPLITPNDMVTLDIDNGLKSPRGGPFLLLPELLNTQVDGLQWRIYRDSTISSIQVKVRTSAPTTRYVLQARQTDQGATIRLIDTEKRATLYEQPLHGVTGSRYPQYCPYATQHWQGLTKGYDTAILRAVGQERVDKVNVETLKPQYAQLSCNLGQEDVDGVRGLREWDGRNVILGPESIRTRLGFCSDSYVALVYVFSRSDDPADLSPVVQLFDRKTLRPIAAFNDGRPCPKGFNGRCEEAPKNIVKGVRIDSASVVIDTEHGPLHAQRLPK